jgi:hypothetical protein
MGEYAPPPNRKENVKRNHKFMVTSTGNNHSWAEDHKSINGTLTDC